MGMQVRTLSARKDEEFERAFAELKRNKIGAVIILPSGTNWWYREKIVALAFSHRISTMWGDVHAVKAGGLMAYTVDYLDLAARAANYVDRIFRGARPGTLPVEQATRYEMVINLKTAKALGVTIPPSLLARADQVIE